MFQFCSSFFLLCILVFFAVCFGFVFMVGLTGLFRMIVVFVVQTSGMFLFGSEFSNLCILLRRLVVQKALGL